MSGALEMLESESERGSFDREYEGAGEAKACS